MCFEFIRCSDEQTAYEIIAIILGSENSFLAFEHKIIVKRFENTAPAGKTSLEFLKFTIWVAFKNN
jgi:hypothetical protein